MAVALTCPHSSSNSDDVEEVHASPGEEVAQPYRIILSEGLYLRRMVCVSDEGARETGGV